MLSITTVLLWILGPLVVAYVSLSEFLDVIGRLEIVENRWPKLYARLSNRPMRLIMLVFLIVLVAKDIQERSDEPKIAPMEVHFAGPAAPIFDQTTPRIQQDEADIAALRSQVEEVTRKTNSKSEAAASPKPRASEPSGPSDTQLADSARELARQLRHVQSSIDFHQKNEFEEHANGHNGPVPANFYTFLQQQVEPYRAQGKLLRRQILDRLPAQPENSTVDMVLNEGSIAGANPLNAVADYFDELAQMLILK